ncbi:hypothetical protein [Aurantiacibacter zhengii]|uniref:Uncharacterized protein n=1 Tax=Aurantiacibacter zhengii TaxID=2307003 RepID=A0A418NMT8_9SPHN|nr:hypothetical protein [Aurantiacibacter zhengii]RIV82683.1 hypothetical protein D2V07_17715 [Aurantiacibacter zhengii]
MKKTTRALIWAAAMLGIAVLAAMGAIERDTATTMLIVLPVVAITNLLGGGCTRPAHGGAK